MLTGRPPRPPLLVTLSAAACLALAEGHRATGQTRGTRLVILGTGTPTADPDRSGPALAIVVGREAYLVDAGPGIVRRASAAAMRGVPALIATNLRRVFITHLHSDHTLGLPDLMFTPWPLGRPTPLDVYGPPGIERMARRIEEAWADDIAVRVNGPEALRQPNYRAVAHEIKTAGQVYDDGVVRVDALAVEHVTPWAYGFRFRTPDRTIVVSGDARPSPSLIEACNKCDVLVHEVYSKEFLALHRSSTYHTSAHTSTAQIAEIAKKTQPRLLVLYHQLYGPATDADLEREVREAGYSGKVASARDLDVF